jgi:ribA/ribD-fused uncharacterized protein
MLNQFIIILAAFKILLQQITCLSITESKKTTMSAMLRQPVPALPTQLRCLPRGTRYGVVLGDSIPREVPSIIRTDIFAFGGFTSVQLGSVVSSCSNLFAPYEKVAILVGTNDLSRGISPAQVVQNIQDLVLQTILPLSVSSQIYVVSLLPRPDSEEMDGKVQLTNKNLSLWCESKLVPRNRVCFLNVAKHFRGKKDKGPKISLFKTREVGGKTTTDIHPSVQLAASHGGDIVHTGLVSTGVNILYQRLSSAMSPPTWVFPRPRGIGWPTIPEFDELANRLVELGQFQPSVAHTDPSCQHYWSGRIYTSMLDRGQAVHIGGKSSIWSNFAPCELWLLGILFVSVEQAYQILKALFCYKTSLAILMLYESDALKLKQLSHFISKQSPRHKQWDRSVGYRVLYHLVTLKYQQNPGIRDHLDNTSYQTIVHAVGDRKWGTNKLHTHPRPICLTGENIFGVMLMRIRDHPPPC